jgi:sporulation integral membrane protein YlbJ
MSIFSGYPSGAKITSELIVSGKITSREGQKILIFSSTSGPLFIIGAVGAGMLKSTEAGYIIFICHILGAIINGILLKNFYKSKYPVNEITNKTLILNRNSSTGNIMSNAIVNSLYTSGFIGGYIILFSVIITLLDKVTFFSSITNIINKVLPNNISWFPGILFKTSLEISNGCKIISSLSTEYELKLILISFIIAFSGFSIIGQVASIINKTKIKLRAYILGKLSHGVISSFLCYLLLKINLIQITTSHSTFFNGFSYNAFLLQLLLCIILLLNILSHIKKNSHCK